MNNVDDDLNEIKEQMASISLVAYEATEARNERREKRLLLIIALLIVLLVGTNGAWLWYESQFETVEETTTITQDNADGYNNYIGNDGVIRNGEADNSN